jgi:hypothetical protein
LRASFKASSGAFFSKKMVNWFEMEKFLLLWVNVKLGLLVIFGEFGKKLAPRPLPFSRILCKNLTIFLAKNYSWPRANPPNIQHHKPTTNISYTNYQQQTHKPAPNTKPQSPSLGLTSSKHYVTVGSYNT